MESTIPLIQITKIINTIHQNLLKINIESKSKLHSECSDLSRMTTTVSHGSDDLCPVVMMFCWADDD